MRECPTPRSHRRIPCFPTDFGKLRYIFELLTPGMVYVSDGAKYERAMRAVLPSYAELVVNMNPIPGATHFGELVNTEPRIRLWISRTPGSTRIPCSRSYLRRDRHGHAKRRDQHAPHVGQQSGNGASVLSSFLADEPPVIVDWLPWNHTFGGNADVGLVIYNGGSLYIDRGKPAPGLFEETIHTLRMICTDDVLERAEGI